MHNLWERVRTNPTEESHWGEPSGGNLQTVQESFQVKTFIGKSFVFVSQAQLFTTNWYISGLEMLWWNTRAEITNKTCLWKIKHRSNDHPIFVISFQDQKGFTTPYQRPNELFQDMAMIQLAFKHDIKSTTDYSEVAFRANLLVEPSAIYWRQLTYSMVFINWLITLVVLWLISAKNFKPSEWIRPMVSLKGLPSGPVAFPKS